MSSGQGMLLVGFCMSSADGLLCLACNKFRFVTVRLRPGRCRTKFGPNYYGKRTVLTLRDPTYCLRAHTNTGIEVQQYTNRSEASVLSAASAGTAKTDEALSLSRDSIVWMRREIRDVSALGSPPKEAGHSILLVLKVQTSNAIVTQLVLSTQCLCITLNNARLGRERVRHKAGLFRTGSWQANWGS